MKQLLFLACALTYLWAQNSVPSPLKNSGDLPEDFYEDVWTKIEKQVSEIKPTDPLAAQKAAFYTKSNIQLNYLFQGGQIIYGDPLNDFVNEVAAKVIGDDTHLLEELRFYINRSSEVNAFSTNQGAIFVNLGLLAQIENEAQLALILAHEIEHYVQGHTLDGYIHEQEVITSDVKIDYTKIFGRSKEMELEADKFGTARFIEAGYMPQALLNTFDVLLYSYLAYDEIVFDSTYFDQNDFKLLQYYVKDDIKSISAREDVDDEEHTHPNIKKRIKHAYKVLEDQGVSKMNEGAIFQVVDEKAFQEIQKRTRYELLRILCENHYYDRALYTTFLLEKTYGTSEFTAWHKALITYFMCTYKLDGKISKAVNNYSKIEGEQQAMNYFLRKLKKKDFIGLTLNQMYSYFEKYPGQQEKYIYFKDLLYKIHRSETINLNELIWEKMETPTLDTTIVAEEPLEDDEEDEEESSELENQEVQINRSSKYAKIKQKKEALKANISSGKYTSAQQKDYLWQHSLVGLDRALFDSINDIVLEHLEIKEADETAELSRKDQKRSELYGIEKHYDHILFLSPQTVVLNIDLSSTKKIEKLKAKNSVSDAFETYASQMNMDASLLNLKHLSMEDTSRTLEYSELYRWAIENLRDGSTHIPYLNNLAHHYRTSLQKDYLGFTMMGTAKMGRKNYSFIYFVNLNLFNGSMEYADERLIKGRLNKLKLEAHIYDILTIIK